MRTDVLYGDKISAEASKLPCKLCNVKPKHLWQNQSEQDRCPFVKRYSVKEKADMIIQFHDFQRCGSMLPDNLRLLSGCYLFQDAMNIYREALAKD